MFFQLRLVGPAMPVLGKVKTLRIPESLKHISAILTEDQSFDKQPDNKYLMASHLEKLERAQKSLFKGRVRPV